MIRFLLVLSILGLGYWQALGQCVVSRDGYGQVITTCELYFAQTVEGQLHKQMIYLGSEFLNFPALQKGKIRIDRGGKEIACQLAYNLVRNEVICQFDGNSAPKKLTPYTFTIGGIKFVRQVNTTVGKDYQIYAIALYDGQTKLLKSLSSQFVPRVVRNGYEKGSSFDGIYQTQEQYFIRRGDARPEPTNLSKASLLSILYDQAEKIALRLPRKAATAGEAMAILAYYDSLTTATQTERPPRIDPAFDQFLHEQIKYPDQAWVKSVYGRVYAGFDISESGQVTNIKMLSPDNIGFGFVQEVEQALQKMAKLKPAYAGTYVLPVAFTYTNSQEETGAYVPVNKLAGERLAGRTVLDELVVPIVVSKPATASREVWGYYK